MVRYIAPADPDHLYDSHGHVLPQSYFGVRQLSKPKESRHPRPPEVHPPSKIKYPGQTDEYNERRYQHAMDLFRKTHYIVPLPKKFFTDQAKNRGWVNARDWDRYESQFPSLMPGGLPQGYNPPSPNPPDPDLHDAIDIPIESLLRIRKQNPLVADGRPGGPGKGKGKVVKRMMAPPQPPNWPTLVAGRPPLNADGTLPLSSQNGPEVSITAIPSVVTSVFRRGSPRITATRDKCRIRHAELLDPVVASILFTRARTYEINPGLMASFQWLSIQARAWERYRFRKLIYHFMTKTIFTSPGSVIMVPDYEPAETGPLTEKIAFTYEDAKESSPYKDFSVALQPSALHPTGEPKLVRSAAVPSTESLVDFDAGRLFICTLDGLDTTTLWGKVWVEYDIEFTIPQSSPLGLADGGYQKIFAPDATTASNFGVTQTETNTSSYTSNALDVITSKVEGTLLVLLESQAGTSSTQSSAPSADATSSVSTALALFGGSATTRMLQAYAWNAKVGSTLTFANANSGTTSTKLFVFNILPV